MCTPALMPHMREVLCSIIVLVLECIIHFHGGCHDWYFTTKRRLLWRPHVMYIWSELDVFAVLSWRHIYSTRVWSLMYNTSNWRMHYFNAKEWRQCHPGWMCICKLIILCLSRRFSLFINYCKSSFAVGTQANRWWGCILVYAPITYIPSGLLTKWPIATSCQFKGIPSCLYIIGALEISLYQITREIQACTTY